MSHTKKAGERHSDIAELYDKIRPIKFAMMTTVDTNGELHSRPMTSQAPEDLKTDGYLWFFTYASASKVGQVGLHQQVNLAYAKPNEHLFVSVGGTATLIRDPQRIRELWRPFYQTWFPNGPDDPDLALLRVHIENAEYWDSSAGKMGLLYSITRGLTSKGKEAPGVDVKLHV
jgi:Uncharacterized stress protein (general stress protein 26)